MLLITLAGAGKNTTSATLRRGTGACSECSKKTLRSIVRMCAVRMQHHPNARETNASLEQRGAIRTKATSAQKKIKLQGQTIRRQADVIAALKASATASAGSDAGAVQVADVMQAASLAAEEDGTSLLDKHLKPGSLGRDAWDTNVTNLKSLLGTGGMKTGFRYAALPSPPFLLRLIFLSFLPFLPICHLCVFFLFSSRLSCVEVHPVGPDDVLPLSFGALPRYSPSMLRLGLKLLLRCSGSAYDTLSETFLCLPTARHLKEFKNFLPSSETGG